MSYIRSAIFISKKKKKKGKVQGYNTSEGRIFDGYCEERIILYRVYKS
jgi:hypothetical protein